jgi:hypothetical protein
MRVVVKTAHHNDRFPASPRPAETEEARRPGLILSGCSPAETGLLQPRNLLVTCGRAASSLRASRSPLPRPIVRRVQGADHILDTIDARIEQTEGIPIAQKAAQFFGLAKESR